MKIERALKETIIRDLARSKEVIIVYGARQVGKTTLIKDILSQTSYTYLYVNADENRYIDILSSRDSRELRALVSGYDLLFIDEAQRVKDIGINLKILIDDIPELKIIVTGSSSLDIASKISEPLTGRDIVYTLYPISFYELARYKNDFELKSILEERLIYGSYPEIFSLPNNIDKQKKLIQLTNSYLYKDILSLTGIKLTNEIRNILKIIAFQIGSEVSIYEISRTIGIDDTTVARYIDLLEKSFVLFRLGGFNRNLRKEVSKMDKIYFYDLGIRNALIDNFKPLKDRNDVGALWENFLIAERFKYTEYTDKFLSRYFWRTHSGAEIDYVEESNGELAGYEFKWGSKKKSAPQTWLNTYSNASYTLLNRENYLTFIK